MSVRNSASFGSSPHPATSRLLVGGATSAAPRRIDYDTYVMTGGDPTDGLAASRSMAHGAQLAPPARKAPTKVAFRCGDREVTYGELDQRVTRLTHALADRGVEFGDRVAMVMTNRIEVAESYLAACRLGAIAVPVNFRLVAEE